MERFIIIFYAGMNMGRWCVKLETEDDIILPQYPWQIDLSHILKEMCVTWESNLIYQVQLPSRWLSQYVWQQVFQLTTVASFTQVCTGRATISHLLWTLPLFPSLHTLMTHLLTIALCWSFSSLKRSTSALSSGGSSCMRKPHSPASGSQLEMLTAHRSTALGSVGMDAAEDHTLPHPWR